MFSTKNIDDEASNAIFDKIDNIISDGYNKLSPEKKQQVDALDTQIDELFTQLDKYNNDNDSAVYSK